MQVEINRESLRKPVRDIYGRDLGQMVGVVLDLNGTVSSIGVDEGSGRLVQYQGNRLMMNNSEYLVMPEWKVEAQGLDKQHEGLRRRARALEELERNGEPSTKSLDQLKGQLDAVRNGHEKLAEQARARLSLLDRLDEEISDFTSMAKLLLASSEIDESAYQVTEVFGVVSIAANGREKEELRKVIGYLEDVEKSALSGGTEPVFQEPVQLAREPSPPVNAQEGFQEVRMSLEAFRKKGRAAKIAKSG